MITLLMSSPRHLETTTTANISKEKALMLLGVASDKKVFFLLFILVENVFYLTYHTHCMCGLSGKFGSGSSPAKVERIKSILLADKKTLLCNTNLRLTRDDALLLGNPKILPR